MPRLVAIALLAALGLTSAVARAQPTRSATRSRAATDATSAPLRGFTPRDLRRIGPLLEQGTVGLVELRRAGRLPAVHLATRVRATPSVVADVIGRPGAYPSFMPAVSEVNVTSRQGDVRAFSWRWRTAIFALEGDAMLTRLSPPAGQARRGHRIVVERTAGDLGRGREVWRILPRRVEGADGSLLVLSTRVDLRDANYLMRQASAASRSLNRSVNLAMGFGMLLRVQVEAERRAGHPQPAATAPVAGAPAATATAATGTAATAPAAGAPSRPDVDLAALEPLLRRGDMLLLQTDGTRLRQANVMSLFVQREAAVRRIMLDPVAFTQALIAGSRADIRERSDDGVAFHWQVDLPIVGTGGDMTLREREDRVVELDATGGAMAGGRWRFFTRPVRGAATAVLGWARFDVGSANFLLRAIVDADAAFEPGLSAATEIMMARALRIRLRGM